MRNESRDTYEHDRWVDTLADAHRDRDADREPVRQPRYPAPNHRRLQLQARFAEILAAGVLQPPTERK